MSLEGQGNGGSPATPELFFKLESFLPKNGILSEVEKIWVREATELAGLHFASLPKFVQIKFKGTEEELLHLFFKAAISFPPKLAELGEILTLREGQFLKDLIPEINSFILQVSGRKDFLRPNFPKSYHYDLEGIWSEDLVKGGYGMYEKKKQGRAGAVAVFRAYGRLHGASWAWTNWLGGEDEVRAKYPLLFKEILDDPAGFDLMESMVGKSTKTIVRLLEGQVEEEDTALTTAKRTLDKFREQGTSVYGEALARLNEPSRMRCVIHSEGWTNNMMFKPDYSNVKLLDFQVARFNSGSLDLADYLATSVSPAVRKEWKSLFHMYYQTLKETVEMTGQDFPFTFNEVLEDFMAKFEVGVIRGIHMILAAEAHDAYDVHDSNSLDPEAYAQAIQTWLKNNPSRGEGMIKEVVELINDLALVQPYSEE